MKKYLYKVISNNFAAFYIAYLQPAINNYVLKIKIKKFKNFGTNVVFKGGGEIFHEENISIFDNTRIGRDYFLMGIGGIEIGEGTIISRNVCIHSGNHNYKSADYVPYDDKYDKRKVTIGKAVWIGQNVSILPGVSIGDGAIIGMGVCVAKNVLPGEIIVSSDNRSLGIRQDFENFQELLSKKKFFTNKYPNA